MEQLITLCPAPAQSAKIQRMQQSELLQLEQVITSVPSACPVCKDSDDVAAVGASDNSVPCTYPVCRDSDDAAAVTVMMLAWTWPRFLDAMSEDVCLATPKHLS